MRRHTICDADCTRKVKTTSRFFLLKILQPHLCYLQTDLLCDKETILGTKLEQNGSLDEILFFFLELTSSFL